MEFLENNSLLNPRQYAYRPNSSCENAILNITEDIYKAIGIGEIALFSLIDLSKAFECVNHTNLLEKLTKLNICTKWFNSYLEDRTQSVRIKNITSKPAINKSGVPQGSIL